MVRDGWTCMYAVVYGDLNAFTTMTLHDFNPLHDAQNSGRESIPHGDSWVKCGQGTREATHTMGGGGVGYSCMKMNGTAADVEKAEKGLLTLRL
jgi:hypothetical protein